MRITVIGTGYLGVVHAAGMAELGHEVLGVDPDREKIRKLAAGTAPFFEPGLPRLIAANTAAGRLTFSTSLRKAAGFGDVHFVCVGTPQASGSEAADLGAVDAVVESLAPHLKRGCLIVGKSTVPVGTAARLGAAVRTLAPARDAVEVAWNPEFLREGFAVSDTLHPDRIVVGVTSPGAAAVLHDVYLPVIAGGAAYIETDLATAELVKVSANAFLAAKLSLINAISEVCDVVGGDVVTLARALALDPRIGDRFLSAGLGFGGGCLPKDIRAFGSRAAELGVADIVTLLRDVDVINAHQRERTVILARQMVGALRGKRIGVLGAAFKPCTDDVRDSPALAVAAALHGQGAHVLVHDPEAITNARASVPALAYTADVSRVFEEADLVMHLTDWPEYGELDPVKLASLTSEPRILDARNALDLGRWRNGGWAVRALGRGALVSNQGKY